MGNQSEIITRQSRLFSLTMKTILILGLFSVLALSVTGHDHGDHGDPNCRCTTLTILDERTGFHVGNCLIRGNDGNFYCYISSTSDCPDKRRSQRANGLFYSTGACDNLGSIVAAYVPDS